MIMRALAWRLSRPAGGRSSLRRRGSPGPTTAGVGQTRLLCSAGPGKGERQGALLPASLVSVPLVPSGLPSRDCAEVHEDPTVSNLHGEPTEAMPRRAKDALSCHIVRRPPTRVSEPSCAVLKDEIGPELHRAAAVAVPADDREQLSSIQANKEEAGPSVLAVDGLDLGDRARWKLLGTAGVEEPILGGGPGPREVRESCRAGRRDQDEKAQEGDPLGKARDVSPTPALPRRERPVSRWWRQRCSHVPHVTAAGAST